ncbi:Zinc ribbon domain protein [Pigmentiphaga humi]|uniref:Zinc ribbon domain protein n=1 Tax=Pigmentiphaga humi TaxID=2478468 RepID=A0A3P4B4A3_9BURK|nr:FmdB family zinc ribbon protein [Pigmentiphaga humi]VCU69985.1 Zinc ribbon domain protein [Pigmentiphaga humi]
MPIYAYKCSACGFEKDALQKMSDAPLTDCPQCGQSAFSKQLTAAGFQLKGSGWYVTDFRNGNKSGSGGAAASPSPASASSASDSAPVSSGTPDSASSSGGGSSPSPAPSASGPAASA